MSIDILPGDLAKATEITQKIRQSEEKNISKNEKACPQYDSPLSSYDNSFKDVTPKGGIRRIITELLNENGLKDLSVLDLAGQGTAFLECKDHIKYITALSLGDYRKSERKESEAAQGLNYITGDIFDPKIREEIGRKKYDIITFRPEGGRHIVSSPEIGFDILSFMYSVLDEKGVILMQVPENIPINQGTDWVNDLSKTEGLEVNFSSPNRNLSSYLLLRKKSGGPKDITLILGKSQKSPNHAFQINTLTWK